MRLIPESDVAIKIETGTGFGSGEIKAIFTLHERPGGGLDIVCEEGKTIEVEPEKYQRMISIRAK